MPASAAAALSAAAPPAYEIVGTLPALRVAEEELGQGRVARSGFGDRVGVVAVAADDKGAHAHHSRMPRRHAARSLACGQVDEKPTHSQS